MKFQLDSSSQTPLFRQIAEQVRELIATKQIKSGDRLPTIRQLAHSLNVNQNTVLRAYLELEQGGVTVSRRGGGTLVKAEANDPAMHMLRQRRLADSVSNEILRLLSLGYSLEELEAALNLDMARWREERKGTDQFNKSEHKQVEDTEVISIVGSQDPALSILVNQLKQKSPATRVEITAAGSLGGLIALQEGRANLAGIHLLDEESGVYNYPYVKHVLPGRKMAVVHLACRIQGLMFAGDNRKNITGMKDLRREDIRFVNRQKGSGTRVLLDLELNKQGIRPEEVLGYGRELNTHVAVATAIAHDEADTGLGIEAAARSYSLGFLPLFREKYDLVMSVSDYRSQLIAPLLEIIKDEDFKETVSHIGGYDTSQTGEVTFCK